MMERLTIDEVIEHCKRTTEKYENLNGVNTLETADISLIFIKEYWEHRQVKEYLEELKRYRDLEEQGLLLRLPCVIGADIYFIPSKTNYKLNILQGYPESNRVYHQNVDKVSFTQYGWYLECDKDIEYATGQIFIDKSYKETWFLTQEEAEQKLKEMESD